MQSSFWFIAGLFRRAWGHRAYVYRRTCILLYSQLFAAILTKAGDAATAVFHILYPTDHWPDEKLKYERASE